MNVTIPDNDGVTRSARLTQFRDLRTHDIFMFLDDFFALPSAPCYVKVDEFGARRMGCPAHAVRVQAWTAVLVPLAHDLTECPCERDAREYLSSTPLSRMARERAP